MLASSTADDVAKIAAALGYEFSGDELLRFSGKKVGRVTVSKQETPGEYNYAPRLRADVITPEAWISDPYWTSIARKASSAATISAAS